MASSGETGQDQRRNWRFVFYLDACSFHNDRLGDRWHQPRNSHNSHLQRLNDCEHRFDCCFIGVAETPDSMETNRRRNRHDCRKHFFHCVLERDWNCCHRDDHGNRQLSPTGNKGRTSSEFWSVVDDLDSRRYNGVTLDDLWIFDQ